MAGPTIERLRAKYSGGPTIAELKAKFLGEKPSGPCPLRNEHGETITG